MASASLPAVASRLCDSKILKVSYTAVTFFQMLVCTLKSIVCLIVLSIQQAERQRATSQAKFPKQERDEAARSLGAAVAKHRTPVDV
jgi:hypothetical protein